MSPAPTLKKTPVAIRIAVVLGGLIVLAAAGYFLLVQPKKKEANKASQEIVQLNQEIADAQAQATQAAGLSKILVADFNKLQTAMPGTAKMDEIYLQLDALTRATGVRFDNVQPGTPIDTSTYQVLPITLIFQGSFTNLSDFLLRLQSLVLVENHKLSASGRLFTVDQVSFSEGENGFPQIMATLQIDAYVYGHPATSSATGPTSTTSTTTSTDTTSTTSTTTSVSG
jgi:type IV pilus assembly protein PilO